VSASSAKAENIGLKRGRGRLRRSGRPRQTWIDRQLGGVGTAPTTRVNIKILPTQIVAEATSREQRATRS